MKVLLSWLNEIAPIGDDVDALAVLMNDLGLAVDAVERVGEPITGVVVARVLALRKHPSADRMQLVDVDLGDGNPLQICCGAFNMEVGQLVPLATIGTVMPNGMEITRAKKRGEWSNGMLCSSAELGLDSDAAGIRILPDGLTLGQPLHEALGLTPDVVFDLDLTRNRPDAWSHLGVARDLAARLGMPLRHPGRPVEVTGAAVPTTVELVDPVGCARFTSTVLTGVQVGPSAPWMAERLARAGMRAINNVVDVSNYVMLEVGQPNHAYDLERLPGRGFRVRRARDGEAITTLDDVERRLSPLDLLICDAEDTPVGIAGIMGGASSEISEATTSLALEAAWFDPLGIAASAARLGLRSEASARFERGCDHAVIDAAVGRFVELLRETCPELTVAAGAVDAVGQLPARPPVRVRTARINALLGSELDGAAVKALLDPIGYVCEPAGGDNLVTIPTWRYDSEVEIDVVEEVARQYGYSRLPKRVPRPPVGGALTGRQLDRRLIREVLIGLGGAEAMPNPFLAPGDLERCGLDPAGITITNPLAAEESVLRTSLLPGLVKAVAYNGSHRRTGVRLFEVGHVYRIPPTAAVLPDEREMVAAAWAGSDAFAAKAIWDELAAALALGGVSLRADALAGLHPTRTARLVGPDGEAVGAIGEVDPAALARHGVGERVAWLEVDLEVALALPHGERPYQAVSRFPSSDFDLAFEVDDAVPAGDIEATLRAAAGELLVSVQLFDVFRGDALGAGRRSLAYRLRLQSLERTLTEADVAAVRQAAISAVTSAHAARLRG